MTPTRERRNATVDEANSHLRILESDQGEKPERLKNAAYFLLRRHVEIVDVMHGMEEKIEAMPDAVCERIAAMPPKTTVTQTTTEFRGPFGIVVKGTPGQIATAIIMFLLAYQFCAVNGWLPWAGAPGAVKELAIQVEKELSSTQGPPENNMASQ